MKHIITLAQGTLNESKKAIGCGECQTSCIKSVKTIRFLALSF